jgi:hypothetical protein
MNGRMSAVLGGIVLVGAFVALAVPEPHAGDARIASTSEIEVCATDGLPGSSYSRAHRVVRRRGVAGHEIDHIVPLCLGGADVDANIQVEPIDEALRKDALEREACIRVCRYHTLSLIEAQSWFIGNWTVAYRREIEGR